MRASLIALVVAWLGLSCSPISAQQPPNIRRVERTVVVHPAMPAEIEAFVNITDSCNIGPLPTIRTVREPAHGVIISKPARLTATGYKNCLSVQAPAVVLFYHSNDGYIGPDVVLLEVRYGEGRTELHRIAINVESSGQKI